jgi:hypothetical protein
MRYGLMGMTIGLMLACAGGPEEVIGDGGPLVVDDPDPVQEKAVTSRCRGPVHRVDHWPGEYPEPVLYLPAPLELPARSDPCDAAPRALCTVPAGLHHPWAGTDATFVSLPTRARYRAEGPRTYAVGPDAMGTLEPDEIVTVETYLSEGFCRVTVRGKTFDSECPGDGFAEVEPASTATPTPLLFSVPCNGSLGWIQADEALATEGVTRGTITGFGTVGPPGAPAAP